MIRLASIQFYSDLKENLFEFRYYYFLQMGYVVEFIKHISKRSQIVAHQLIWNMQTNMYMDEDQQHRDRKWKSRMAFKTLKLSSEL